MSWSKLKTIIIYILLLLNLFLLGLVGVNLLRARHYQNTALEQAAAVLGRSNIRVRWEDLPNEMKLSAATAARDLQKEEQLAAALLGDGVRSSASGGGLYVYEGASGTARFRGSGEFTVTYAVPRGQSVTPQEMMNRLGLETGPVREGDGATAVEQRVSGVPVYSTGSAGQDAAGMIFEYDSLGQLCAVSGRLFLGKPTDEQEEKEPASVSTALIAFFNFVVENGDVCREIANMTPVYRAVGDQVRLAPAWLIRTDTGSYFVDAVTAEVSRAQVE